MSVELGLDPGADLRRARLWHHTVRNFTARQVTVPEDRLLALSGIANELARVWDDAYVFGLWKRGFVRHLSWEVNPMLLLSDQAKDDVRKRNWSAPS